MQLLRLFVDGCECLLNTLHFADPLRHESQFLQELVELAVLHIGQLGDSAVIVLSLSDELQIASYEFPKLLLAGPFEVIVGLKVRCACQLKLSASSQKRHKKFLTTLIKLNGLEDPFYLDQYLRCPHVRRTLLWEASTSGGLTSDGI